MKRQLSNHESAIQGMICANDCVIPDYETLIGAAGSEKPDEDELNAKIESLETVNTCLRGSISVLYTSVSNPVIGLSCGVGSREMISRLEKCIAWNLVQIPYTVQWRWKSKP